MLAVVSFLFLIHALHQIEEVLSYLWWSNVCWLFSLKNKIGPNINLFGFLVLSKILNTSAGMIATEFTMKSPRQKYTQFCDISCFRMPCTKHSEILWSKKGLSTMKSITSQKANSSTCPIPQLSGETLLPVYFQVSVKSNAFIL